MSNSEFTPVRVKLTGCSFSESDTSVDLRICINGQTVFQSKVPTYTNRKFNSDGLKPQLLAEVFFDQSYSLAMQNPATVALTVSNGNLLFCDFQWGFKKSSSRSKFQKISQHIVDAVILDQDLSRDFMIIGKHLFAQETYLKIQSLLPLSNTELDDCFKRLTDFFTNLDHWRTQQGYLTIQQQRYLLQKFYHLLPEHLNLLLQTGHGIGCDVIDEVIDITKCYRHVNQTLCTTGLLITDHKVRIELATHADSVLKPMIQTGLVTGTEYIENFNKLLYNFCLPVVYQSALGKSYNWKYGSAQFSRIFSHAEQPWVITNGITATFDYNYFYLLEPNDK